MEAILAALQIHGPVTAVVLGLVYLGSKHLKEDVRTHHETEKRLLELETNRVKRADLERVYDRVEALGSELHEGQQEVLGLLVQLQNKR